MIISGVTVSVVHGVCMFLLSYMIDTIFILSENAQYVNKKFIKFANNWGNPYLDISCSILLNKRRGETG